MITSKFGTATTSSGMIYCEDNYSDIAEISEVASVFEHIFGSNKSLRERNKNLIASINNLLAEGKKDVIENFLSDKCLSEAHPSFLKTILVITNTQEGIVNQRKQIQSYLDLKRESY